MAPGSVDLRATTIHVQVSFGSSSAACLNAGRALSPGGPNGATNGASVSLASAAGNSASPTL